MISYVVPSFNHAKYVVDCLESIKADIYCDYEIIIIDDGSTDNSVEVIEDWIAKNQNLKIQFIKQNNRGVCSTLNRLISLAQGEYIRPVASDDLINNQGTKILVNALEENQNILVAFGDCQTINAVGETLSESHIEYLGKNKDFYAKDLKKAIISQWAISGPALVYRKGFEKEIGSYDESLLIEDWNMYLRLAGMGKLIFVDSVVAKYRIHDTNTSITVQKDKKIRNLESQYKGGAQNLKFFNNKYQNLLRAELFLIQAKIFFLKRKYVLVFFELVRYFLKKL